MMEGYCWECATYDDCLKQIGTAVGRRNFCAECFEKRNPKPKRLVWKRDTNLETAHLVELVGEPEEIADWLRTAKNPAFWVHVGGVAVGGERVKLPFGNVIKLDLPIEGRVGDLLWIEAYEAPEDFEESSCTAPQG